MFLNDERRCVLHLADDAEDLPVTLKPFFCRVFPLAICDGHLMLDEPVAGDDRLAAARRPAVSRRCSICAAPSWRWSWAKTASKNSGCSSGSMMGNVLIIGAGGVGGVVAQKCAMNRDVFEHDPSRLANAVQVREDSAGMPDPDRHLAGRCRRRRRSSWRCSEGAAAGRDQRRAAVPGPPHHGCVPRGRRRLPRHRELRAARRREVRVQVAVGLPGAVQDEGPHGVLGSGFDPGVANVFCAYVQKHLLDEIHYVDIVDCNAGSHGKAFATNFNPEINIREITARGRYWENGEWKETDPLSVSQIFDYPGVGEKELPALSRGARVARRRTSGASKRIRFWMTFRRATSSTSRCCRTSA